jgi:hypothetical protein
MRGVASEGLPGGNPPGAARLKPEHAAVCDALRLAVSKLQQPVGCATVVGALTPAHREMLATTYRTRLVPGTVAKILQQLTVRGVVVSPGRGWRRYYTLPDLLDVGGVTPTIPEAPSARQRAFRLVTSAAEAYGRAVRRSEILQQSACRPELERLSGRELTRAVASLVLTGDVVVAGIVRGGGSDGRKLYLPASHPLSNQQEGPTASSPSDGTRSPRLRSSAGTPEARVVPRGASAEPEFDTHWAFLEVVAAAWDECWTAEVQRAGAAGGDGQPRPLTTAMVRARVISGGGVFAVRAKAHPMHLINAMQQLARTERPVVRVVLKRAGHRAALWSPVDVPDAALDIAGAFATDTARIAEAVRGCARNLGVPAVTRQAIVTYAGSRAALQPVGEQPIAATLSAFASEQVHDAKRGNHWRGARPVVYLGRVGTQTYYAAPHGVPGSESFGNSLAAAAHYVTLRREEHSVRRLCSEDRVAGISLATAPGVRLGRASLMTQEATKAAASLDALLAAAHVRPEDRRLARHMRVEVARVLAALRYEHEAALREWPIGTDLPARARSESPCLTAEDLGALIAPYDRRGTKLTRAQLFSSVASLRVRRVPNPGYISRRAGTPEELYDRFDALTQAGIARGGRECSSAAALARQELELLRDPNYVFPGLQHIRVEVRLASIACLAYLRPEGAGARLESLALEDVAPGVRRLAWWACGFLEHLQLLQVSRRVGSDPSPIVRSLVRDLEFAAGDWWAV